MFELSQILYLVLPWPFSSRKTLSIDAKQAPNAKRECKYIDKTR